jgi:peptidoglycan/xylan/chitin deacetylase (PgdA/CDA1 family)
VFLTFDDGPTPGVTLEVLSILEKFNAKATFFCLGKNVEAHPELYAELSKQGHSIGNHSYSHMDGWRTEAYPYVRDVLKCAQHVSSKLFRPPYGHISRKQAQVLKSRYHLVMWDVISGDFDLKISADKCVDNVLQHTRPGSIIVFHDSVKAAPRMLNALPRVLTALQNEGYKFSALTSESIEGNAALSG